MSGFADTWLALREPADTDARSSDLEARLRDRLSATSDLRLLDLGAGTGANFRHLSPRLTRSQQWTLIDNDATLLGHLPIRLASWVGQQAARIDEQEGTITIDAPGFTAIVYRQMANLATDLDTLDVEGHDIVTCSALLDLAGDDWLRRLADRCLAARCIGYFVLSYDGRMRWTPASDDDAGVCDRFNRHQRRDKGLGLSLGPDAADTLIRYLRERAFTVHTARSDWQLDMASQALQRELDTGIARAVGELDPAFAGQARRWLAERQAAADQGLSGLTVGHVDILALPPITAP